MISPKMKALNIELHRDASFNANTSVVWLILKHLRDNGLSSDQWQRTMILGVRDFIERKTKDDTL